MSFKRIIIVSNRLPFQLIEKKGQLSATPNSGGLVSSLRSFIERKIQSEKNVWQTKMLWVGHSDISEKRFKEYTLKENMTAEGFELHPVALPVETKDKYYNGFSNDTIWPLFHYFPSYAKFNEEYYRHFVIANNLFCEKVLQVYQPGDMIWIHDYHLMLLPALLRRRIPDAAIGFFLHIPFPSFELYRLLPAVWRKEILEGILGADLVGFHTNDYLLHFIHSIKQILGYENILRTVISPERSITVDSFPISIDFNKFYAAGSDPDSFSERNRIKKNLAERKLIVSVDRLDYTKGIVNRLEGFELFLENNPEYRGAVKFILVVVPSRDIITKYKESKKRIEGLVSKINGRFGSFDWTPVVYQYKSIDFKRMTGMYLAADVALITPLRDGMNLVAKEFIACRSDKRGVLILSETAGAASELGEALIINPSDRNDISNALSVALKMPLEEQIRRNAAMQSRIKHYDVVKWAEDFITQLEISKDKQGFLKIKEINAQIERDILSKYLESNRRAIFLDYDGTLTPLAKLPQEAVPDEMLLRLLRALSADAKNSITIISGRDKNILDKWFGDLPIHLIAEHGAFIKLKGKGWTSPHGLNAEWKASVLPVMEMTSERCAGSFVENKTLSLAWHFRNSENDLAFLRSRELINTLSEISTHLDFHVLEGHKVIEARTRGIDKGAAASNLLSDSNYDFILAIGDDRTDEDLFRALPKDGISIRVGMTPSVAKFNLKNQKEVITFLNKMISSPNLKI